VSYRADTLSNRLTLDLSGDRLADVTKKITDLSGINFFVPHALSEQRLSGYIVDMPFGTAIQSIAAMNGLEAVQDTDSVWAFYTADVAGQPSPVANSAPAYRRRMPFSPTELSIDSLGLITAQIGRGSVQDIITDLCEQQRLNYFFVSPIQGQTSIYVREVDFRTLLDVMLLGTAFSYHHEDGIYIFSTAGGKEGLPVVEKVDMKYRSVDKLSEVIPDALKSGVQVKEFADLNSIILCGERAKVSRIENFLRTVDRRVPMVTIEIMIVDATKSNMMDIGMEAGFGKSGVQSAGSLLGGVDITLNAASVNNLINSFNGFGSVNLGKVSSGFYFGLQFLEENGVIDMRSTPKLSTLNGHEATLKSGETRYYKEVSNNYYGSQIPVSTESYMWKSVDANLDIKITPFVSEDKHITLDIQIDQTEFTAREETEAPPGTATRSFSSLIRVQNEEMVLLGGIDQNVKEKSTRGLPWISRVPVLRWLFGKSRDQKKEHLLNVFIKPTLIE
jgi:type IV pilus assembly protein PilQ